MSLEPHKFIKYICWKMYMSDAVTGKIISNSVENK